MSNYWDIHNHILPGVDDGSSCFDEAVDLIDSEHEQGVRTVVFTPHFRPEMFEISAEDRLEVYMDTVSRLEQRYKDMRFYLGCELYLEERTIKYIGDIRNRMCTRPVVLVEFSYGVEFSTMVKLISGAIANKVRVIIAHIERYDCIREDINRIKKLRSMGCMIQVNSDSVIGKYGLSYRMFTNRMLKENLVDFIASDAHDTKRRQVRMQKAMSHVTKKYGEEMTNRLFRDNAAALFNMEVN